MSRIPTLLPGPTGRSGATAPEQVAELLARPGAVTCLHRPVVGLADGRCQGYAALLPAGDDSPEDDRGRDDTAGGYAGRDDIARDDAGRAVAARDGHRGPVAWYRAAARAGLSGRLGATALGAALRERATMPGDRFLAVTLDPAALGHPEVVAVLDAEDDVADLLLVLVDADVPAGHRAGPVLDRLRARGLQLALPAGSAGLGELRLLERLHPDVVVLGVDLVRDLPAHRLRERLAGIVVELADELGAATLAEEVESLDETVALRALGVRMAGGWLFGRPGRGFPEPPAEVCEWLRLQ